MARSPQAARRARGYVASLGGVSAPVNSVRPAISGTAREGQILTVSNGSWTNNPTSYACQWKRDGVAIAGAVNSTRTLTAADIGAVITCTVTASNDGGSASATSLGTSAVIAASQPVPVNTVAPAVTGAGMVGQVLTSDTGTWTNSPTGYAYQWRRNGVDIAGAVTSTYTLVSADGGASLTCRVTATNTGGSAGATSNAVSVAAAPTATLSAPSTVNEGAANTTTPVTHTLTINRNGAVGDIAFTYGFTGGTALEPDFSGGAFPSGSGVVLTGQDTATFPVTIAGNDTVDINRTVKMRVTLTASGVQSNDAPWTIVNDDFETLQTLSIADTTFYTGSAKSVPILGATSGSAISMNSLAGFSVSGTMLMYDGSGATGARSLVLTETKSGAIGSPKTGSSIGLTVGSAITYTAAYTNALAEADNVLLTALPGWAAGAGSGATSGFKFTSAKLVTPNTSRTKFVVRDAGAPSYIVKVKGQSGQANIVLRYTDNNNYLIATFAPTNMNVSKVVAGVLTAISGSVTRPNVVGDVLEVTLQGNNVSWKIAGVDGRVLGTSGVYDVSDVPSSNMVGFVDQGVFTYNNIEVAPLDGIARFITMAEVGRVQQRERTGANAGKATVALKGTYNGFPPNRYAAIDNATGLEITGHAAQAATVTTAGGTWAFTTPTLPAGLTAYRIRMWRDDQPLQIVESQVFYVGEFIMCYGQSGASGYGSAVVVSTDYTPSPAAWYFVSQTGRVPWNNFLTTTTARFLLGKLATQLAGDLGCAVGMICIGGGGQTLQMLQKGDTTGSQLYDKAGEGASLVETMKLTRTKAGMFLFLHHGPSDASNNISYQAYRDGLGVLVNSLRTDFGLGANGSDAYFFIDMLDCDTGAAAGIEYAWPRIRKAQNDYCVGDPKAAVIDTAFDATHQSGDALHRDVAGYLLPLPRMRKSINKALLGTGTDGRGPLPTGVTRAGSSLTISYSANGCTGLTAGSGAVPSNYQIGSDNTFGTLLTPTSYTVDGTAMTVTLNFASALPPGVAVRTFQVANPIKADFLKGTYSDGDPPVPPYPIFEALVAA